MDRTLRRPFRELWVGGVAHRLAPLQTARRSEGMARAMDARLPNVLQTGQSAWKDLVPPCSA